MMKFKKKPIMIDTDSDEGNPMSGSMSFEIGSEGLKFLKDNLQIGKKGVINTSTGEVFGNLGPEDIEFHEMLGRGAAGYVQRAIYKPKGIPLAIKTVNIYDKDRRHQLLNDLKAFINCNCPFLVQFHGSYIEEGIVKVALELMDLGSIAALVKLLNERSSEQKRLAIKKKSPLIPEPILAKLAQQILSGLLYLHKCKKQVHRDIKPDNILLNSRGEAKLSDFGISKELDKTAALCNTFVGTMAYMSPERVEGEGKKYSYPSDVWSFGLVLYEMATGLYAYPQSGAQFEMLCYIKSNPAPTLPNDGTFSSEFCDFMKRCLQKDPEKRDTIAELSAHPWILQHSYSEVDLEAWAQDLLRYKKAKSKVGDIPTAKVCLNP